MARRSWGLALLLATAACSPIADRNGDGRLEVACVGDSNTFSVGGVSWCGFLLSPMRARWTNVAAITAGAFGGHYIATNDVREGVSLDARDQVARLLAAPVRPDVAVLAFGTNDVRLGFEPAAIADEAVALRDRLASRGVVTFVALVPPFGSPAADAHPEWNDRVAVLNEVLRARIPPGAVVDWTAFPDGDYDGDAEGPLVRDGVHFNPRGQVRRAAVVWKVIGWPWA